jgi:hypothetical protein
VKAREEEKDRESQREGAILVGAQPARQQDSQQKIGTGEQTLVYDRQDSLSNPRQHPGTNDLPGRLLAFENAISKDFVRQLHD